MSGNGWVRDGLPQSFLDQWHANCPGVPAPQGWLHAKRQLSALVGREPLPPPDGPLRWHISMKSLRGRVPAWEELVQVAHDLRPGVPMAVGIPPRSWWMNVHPDVLHLWEVHDEQLVKHWRLTGELVAGTAAGTPS